MGRSVPLDEKDEVPLGFDRLQGLLAHLQDRGMDCALHRFAAGVAPGLVTVAPPAAAVLISAAKRGEAADFTALRKTYASAAQAAGAIGLRHGAANAAALLTAYAACHPDAHTAATETSRMARLYAELSGGVPESVTQAHLDVLAAGSTS